METLVQFLDVCVVLCTVFMLASILVWWAGKAWEWEGLRTSGKDAAVTFLDLGGIFAVGAILIECYLSFGF